MPFAPVGSTEQRGCGLQGVGAAVLLGKQAVSFPDSSSSVNQSLWPGPGVFANWNVNSTRKLTFEEAVTPKPSKDCAARKRGLAVGLTGVGGKQDVNGQE